LLHLDEAEGSVATNDWSGRIQLEVQNVGYELNRDLPL